MAQIFADSLNGVLLPLAAALAVFLAVYLGMSGYHKMRYPHFPQPSQNQQRGRFRRNIEALNDRAAPRAAPFAYGKNLISRNLINHSEKRFFQILCEAMPDCHVFPQVSFNALVTHAPWIRYLHWERFVRRSFNAKYVDFVVCRKSDFGVVAVVEFDGSGHVNHDDERRDELLKSVGYRVERFADGDALQSVKFRFSRLSEAQQGVSNSVVQLDFPKAHNPWA
jgi:very-short-patch-repair endonuclease